MTHSEVADWTSLSALRPSLTTPSCGHARQSLSKSPDGSDSKPLSYQPTMQTQVKYVDYSTHVLPSVENDIVSRLSLSCHSVDQLGFDDKQRRVFCDASPPSSDDIRSEVKRSSSESTPPCDADQLKLVKKSLDDGNRTSASIKHST